MPATERRTGRRSAPQGAVVPRSAEGGATFRAGWTVPARRDMARLPPRVATAVAVYVEERLREDPWRGTKALGGDLEGTRGARNGDYRLLVQIDDSAHVVWVLHVDHRAHAYRPR